MSPYDLITNPAQIITISSGSTSMSQMTTLADTPSDIMEADQEVENVSDRPQNLDRINEDCTRYAGMWPSIPLHLFIPCIDNISPFQVASTASSDIFKGYHKGTAVAMKRLRSSTAPTEAMLMKIYFEALLLLRLRHPNIIPWVGLYMGQSPQIFIVSKFMKHGVLPQYLAAFPEADRLSLLTGVADAITYLHTLPTPVLHGDIRGVNVVVYDDGSPCLIDVGCSLIMDRSSSSFFPSENILSGSPRWTPGEKLYPGEFRLTLKADVYSYACLCVEVFSGEIPFRHLSNDGAVIVEILIKRRHPRRPRGPGARQLTDTLWSMLENCFARDPATRPPINSIHKFLASQASGTVP